MKTEQYNYLENRGENEKDNINVAIIWSHNELCSRFKI